MGLGISFIETILLARCWRKLKPLRKIIDSRKWMQKLPTDKREGWIKAIIGILDYKHKMMPPG
ncbi:hypothetical protein ACMD2_17412 [Ananas comosus]|uniref:Uncharacterized protein n=1 Tax=Ananas comosus TaxID=4615 RepID=A0A199VZF2_ANACO|nr:hypothetical protein ACMD2_17412 [Ananas comosus]